MKNRYIAAMGMLHRLCIFISASCLVVMALIIPWGVFTRYVLGYGSSWPEPLAILLMVVFTFFAACACYRDNLHIAVMAIPDMVSPRARRALGYLAETCMIATSLFMLVWGAELMQTTWHQVIAEFPIMSVGLTYSPVPIGGTITLLFVVERLWTGAIFAPSDGTSLGSSTSME